MNQDKPSLGGFSVLGVVGAVIAALVGALVWAAISYYANYEVGWIAWGIGGLVGGAVVLVGGRGIPMAVLAAVLALASIVGGKWLAVEWSLDSFIEETSTEIHGLRLAAAQEYVDLDAEDDVAVEGYMNDYGYEDMTIAEFREQAAPNILAAHENPPSIEDIRTEFAGDVEFNIMEIIQEDLHLLDILLRHPWDRHGVRNRLRQDDPGGGGTTRGDPSRDARFLLRKLMRLDAAESLELRPSLWTD